MWCQGGPKRCRSLMFYGSLSAHLREDDCGVHSIYQGEVGATRLLDLGQHRIGCAEDQAGHRISWVFLCLAHFLGHLVCKMNWMSLRPNISKSWTKSRPSHLQCVWAFLLHCGSVFANDFLTVGRPECTVRCAASHDEGLWHDNSVW